MIIFVNDLKKRTLTLDIDPSNLIIEIKNKIHEKIGIYTKFIRLIFAGKELLDEREAREYNIARDSTLHMIIGLRKFEGG